MKSIVQTTFLLLAVQLLSIPSFAFDASSKSLVERGRYLVKVTGCNDCHTPGYMEKNGQVPEVEWLIGNNIGFKGAWGTTYPTNLRYLIARKTEDQWIKFAQHLRTKPPMPWYNVNAMSKADLQAVYYFIRYLGDSSNPTPRRLDQGQQPRTPYINFEVVIPNRG